MVVVVVVVDTSSFIGGTLAQVQVLSDRPLARPPADVRLPTRDALRTVYIRPPVHLLHIDSIYLLPFAQTGRIPFLPSLILTESILP